MGPISAALKGKRIAQVYRNEVSLVIRCEDGVEIQIGWADPVTKQPVHGEPVVVFLGKRIQVASQEIDLKSLVAGAAR